MFGLSFEKLLILALIAVVLIGPSRLPQYAAQLARLVKRLREMASGAKDRMRDEMGPEFDEVDWKRLDPRQYDPRRIIREALFEDDDDDPRPVVRPAESTVPAQEAKTEKVAPLAGAVPPFDGEAT